MGGDPIWRALPFSPEADMPTLLASIHVEASAYTVRVTDMANMWIESLDRKAICMRGWGENTSIDPSDTPENMATFLASIHAAMDPTLPRHDKTSMSLSQGSMADTGEGGLTLRVRCELPGLAPLKWPIYLKKAPSSSIATSLVLPLVQAQDSRQQELESLVTMIGQKDAVITKLLDKLEASGVALEHIFNPLSGKRKVSRAVAEGKVKGLAAFNRAEWERELPSLHDVSGTASDLVCKVFERDPIQIDHNLNVEDSPKLDMWWRDFKDTVEVAHSGKNTGTSSKDEEMPDSLSHKEDNEGDDDFQVQATPPHLKIPDDASTCSEGEDAGSAKPPPKSERKDDGQEKKPQGGGPRLGMIGGKKTASSKAQTKKPTPPAPDNEETASEDGDATVSEAGTASPLPSPVKKASVPAKGRLGRIGGKAAAAKVEEPETAPREEAAKETEPIASRPRAQKIGMIGKNTKVDTKSEPATEETTSRGRQTTKQEPETQEKTRETSTERADRRREELKRELEKKAAAGPAKKKRKF